MLIFSRKIKRSNWCDVQCDHVFFLDNVLYVYYVAVLTYLFHNYTYNNNFEYFRRKQADFVSNLKTILLPCRRC